MDTLRACEEIRHAGTLDEAAKAKLRESGSEFSLFTDAAGKRRFRRSHSESHTAAVAEPWTLSWSVTNPFAGQPIKLRIEALMSAGSNDESGAVVLGSLSGEDAANWKASAARGVVVSQSPLGVASPGALLTATNSGRVERRAAWACYRKQFKPALDLKRRQALGLWIDGDGSGEVIAVRLESPQHLAFGAVADRYVTVDFTGKRWFTLVETESARWSDYTWDDGKGLYNLYRETIDFGAVESVAVWCQNLPSGKEVKCGVGPINALPMLAGTIEDPAITIGGVTTTFPGELASGGWIECEGPQDCTLYGPKGDVLAKLSPSGNLPTLRAGQSRVQFSCASGKGPSPRVKVTEFHPWRGALIRAEGDKPAW